MRHVDVEDHGAADDGSPLRLYYTGCNGPFFGSRGCAMGLATVQREPSYQQRLRKHLAGVRVLADFEEDR